MFMKYLAIGFIFMANYWWLFVGLAIVALIGRFLVGNVGPQ